MLLKSIGHGDDMSVIPINDNSSPYLVPCPKCGKDMVLCSMDKLKMGHVPLFFANRLLSWACIDCGYICDESYMYLSRTFFNEKGNEIAVEEIE